MQRSAGCHTVNGREIVRLTTRQLQVLRLACRAKSNKEIGALLEIHALSVQRIVSQMMRDLKLYSRLELVTWALSNPQLIAEGSCEVVNHPEGCTCGAPYCEAMRERKPVLGQKAG